MRDVWDSAIGEILLVAHCLELGAQVFDLVQELQRQRGPRQVNAEIALQAHGDSRSAHLRPGEAPVPRVV